MYLAVCFLVFTAWLVCFAQHALFPGGEQALSLTYLLNLFFVYFLMVPFIHFFQVETYYKALMGLADGTGHLTQFYGISDEPAKHCSLLHLRFRGCSVS